MGLIVSAPSPMEAVGAGHGRVRGPGVPREHLRNAPAGGAVPVRSASIESPLGQLRQHIVRTLAVAALLAVTGCGSTGPLPAAPGPSTSRPYPQASSPSVAEQAALTPDAVLARLRAGNARFVAGRPAPRNHYLDVKATGQSQHPIAAVVSCSDARSAPEIVFDQGIGDLMTARVAGNVVNQDILGGLEYAAAVAGAKLIVVLGHSHCSVVEAACREAGPEGLTRVIEELGPAVDRARARSETSRADAVDLTARAERENVFLGIRRILEDSPLLRDMVRDGRVAVVGALLDVETGRVSFEP